MLVLLRVTIGWHFLYAGISKLTDPAFSSEGFLRQAKGPLAEKFRSLLPDPDGRLRLDEKTMLQAMQEYVDAFVSQHGLKDADLARARKALSARQEQFKQFLADNREAIADYMHELDRLSAARNAGSSTIATPTQAEPKPAADAADEAAPKEEPAQDAGAQVKEGSTHDKQRTIAIAPSIPFQQKRLWDKQTELAGKVRPWLTHTDQILHELRQDLAGLLPAPQRRAGTPEVTQGPVGADQEHLRQMDRFIIYSNLAVGVCLIVGLFTRLASFGGGLFLLSIVLAQPDWPGLYPAPHPSAGQALIVTKEFVEMMAMFFLATTHVGRWGGLDFFIHHLIVRPIFGKRE